jgi:ribonuclease BN (tRNA processing enzyme)
MRPRWIDPASSEPKSTVAGSYNGAMVLPTQVTRRTFLTAGASVLGTAVTRGQTPGPPASSRTRLILLGTAGGPAPKVIGSAPAQAIVIGDRIYLVDCGDGVARQMALAKLQFRDLRAIFITHQHSDHNAGYGPLFLLGWTAGLSTVDAYGPPPLEKMTRLLLEAYAFDIETRIADEGRPPLAPLIHAHDIAAAGEIFNDDRVKVTTALNRHPPIEHSFAYRFDAADRSVVISGDTNYSEAVIGLAKGADVLVHEALYRPYFEEADTPQPRSVRQHIIASHTHVEDVGRVAAAAGVKQLVLSHLVPSAPAGAVSDEQWLAGARKHYSGPVIIGRDLMEL